MTARTEASRVAAKRESLSVRRFICRAVGWGLGAVGAVTLVISILVFHKAVPPIVDHDPAGVEKLEVKLRQAEVAAASGAPQAVGVDEGELNSIIDSKLGSSKEVRAQQSNGSLRDLRIKLVDDRMHVYVVLDFHGKDMTLDLEGKLHTENGYVQFDPVSGKIGALPIPRSTLETAVRRMMDSPENREELRLPANLRDLRVESGKIVVVYK